MADSELISPVTTRNPEFVITSAPLNNMPVELDGRPADPEKVAEAHGVHRDQPSADEMKVRYHALRCTTSADIYSQRKEQLHSERKGDPAVLVDIPQTPGAEELAKSGAGILDEAGAQVARATS